MHSGRPSLPFGHRPASWAFPVAALLLAASCDIQNPVLRKADVTPAFLPEGGPYPSARTVSITVADGSRTIAYTTDGSDPRSGGGSTSFAQGTATLEVGHSRTLRAAVRFDDGSFGPLGESKYSILEIPIPTLGSGDYLGSQIVRVTCATPGAVIHCTYDGTVPTLSSPVCPEGLIVDTSTTLRAVSWKEGWGTSPDTTVRYLLKARPPTTSAPAGVYTSARSISLQAASGATIHCTTDGSQPTDGSPVCSGPIVVDTDLVLRAVATRPGQATSSESSFAYTILRAPSIVPTAGFYETPETLRIVAPSRSGATLRYTLDGTAPTANSSPYTAPVVLSSPSQVRAAVVLGASIGPIASSNLEVVVPPSMSPRPGSYAGSVQVRLATPTAGAKIRYTTDSGIPNRSSASYGSALSVTKTTTLRAATEVADTVGGPVTGTYVILPASTVPPPTIGLAGGSYVGRQLVSLATASSGAQIRYTLDGTFPDQDDSLYTQPIPLEYSTNLLAVAIDGGVSSQPASASYTISPLQAPSFDPYPGTYKGNQAVFVKSGTSGASVHCTRDGSTPTASSPTCNGAITVYGGTTTIRAVATYAGQVSRETNATYTITSTSTGGGGGGSGTCAACSYTQTTMRSRISSDQSLINQLVSTSANPRTIQSARDQLAADQNLLNTLIQCGCK